MRLRGVAGCLAATLCLLLGACGVPGEPLPPLLEIPAPVHDLAVEQVGAKIFLRFSVPQLTTEGTRVRDLSRIEIHGAVLPAESLPETFPEQARILATLPAVQLPEGQGQITYELPLDASERGRKALLAVKAINRRGKDAGFSNIAAVEILDLPDPPGDLSAMLTEQAIQLRWTPAQQSAFGGPAPTPDGYEVYRSEAGSTAPAQLLGTADSPSYDDRAFSFGTRYAYTVRAFARRGDSTARTAESNRVEIAAEDRFPPTAPQNLRAVAGPGAVELAWSPNAEPDLAGYYIYRSEGGSFTRLNREMFFLPLFRDSTVQPGTSYRYVVKAVDRAGNEGAASAEAAATGE